MEVTLSLNNHSSNCFVSMGVTKSKYEKVTKPVLIKVKKYKIWYSKFSFFKISEYFMFIVNVINKNKIEIAPAYKIKITKPKNLAFKLINKNADIIKIKIKQNAECTGLIKKIINQLNKTILNISNFVKSNQSIICVFFYVDGSRCGLLELYLAYY